MATVCGTVASTDYAETVIGSPTFLYLDQPYPSAVFAIVIWGSTRGAFDGAPEELFAHARVCIRGWVNKHNGLAEIESDGGDIEVY